ncbi:hypothetical protein [Thermus thalpophilus]|uniref:hypothetical protein n=1 Tax=Thermus thalpophilus TaxID=2908147 RepID=UPI001FAA7921|nr:hypothetical protein [Thermus thalpophilus]
MGRILLAVVALLLPAHAQEWRLTRSQSLTQEGTRAWRYTLSPADRAGRELWQKLVLQYQDHLRAGYRVDLGSWRLYFLGGRLRLEPHCPQVNPACFTFGALPVEKGVQDRFLLGLSQLLDQALAQARNTGGNLTLSGLFRVELKPGQAPPYLARPSGWAP